MLAYLSNACNNFKYLDTGDEAPDVEGLFEDSLSDSSLSENDKTDQDEIFADFDNHISSNRSAV